MERELMRAVVVQAMRDALTPADEVSDQREVKKPHYLDRIKAINWFNVLSRDMRTICWCADIEPVIVRKKFRAWQKLGVQLSTPYEAYVAIFEERPQHTLFFHNSTNKERFKK